MKKLKILSNINGLAVGAYIPYILLNYNDFFYAKDKSTGVMGLSLVMFFATFICGGITLVIAGQRDVDSSFDFKEIKNVSKATLIILFSVYLVGIILMIWKVRNDTVIMYIGFSTITLAFTIAEKIIIPKIDTSTTYKISLPWYIYPIPFIVFFGGTIIITQVVAYKQQDALIITLFVLSGIMMIGTAWHGDYTVDETLKTIEKSNGLFSFLKTNKTEISYKDISYVKKKGIYYIIINGTDEMKINRLSSGMKRLKKTFDDNGIIIV
jgi:hypothetical protein